MLFRWKGILAVFIASILLCALSNAAEKNKPPLPLNEAFIFSINYSPPQLFLNWQIAPDYYIYRDRIKLSTNQGVAVQMDFPQGDLKYSDTHGRYEVYHNNITVPATLDIAQFPLNIIVKYQGCAEDGFCYPPQEKQYMLMADATLVPLATSKTTVSTLLTNQHQVAGLLYQKNFGVLLLLFFCLGLLLAFTPCVLPMVPILTSIIIGQKKATTKRAFFLSLTYVLGMAITYAAAGLLAATIGSSLNVWLQKPIVITIVSVIFVLLSFSLFGFYHLRLPHKWHQHTVRLNHYFQGGAYFSVFLMGVVSTLVVSPCITAPLMGVLIYIGQSGNLLLGASALFSIGLGMGVPLLLIGMSAGHWLPKRGPWMEAVKMVFGVMMLAMAVWLYSRLLTTLHSVMLWGAFFVIVAIILIRYLPTISRKKRIIHAIAYFLGVVGIFLVLSSEFMPTLFENLLLPKASINSANFFTVRDVENLQTQLKLAREVKKPVLVDFYADWCESCVSMEHKVFSNKNVLFYLKNYVLIRVDISANDTAAQTLLTHFKVIAPPTILFYNSRGKELIASRIVGEMNADEFIAHIKALSN